MLAITATTLFAQNGAEATTLYIYPTSIEDPTISPGDTITVYVMISAVVDLKKCEFNLTFNPAVLQVLRITKLRAQGQYPESKIDMDSDVGYLRIELLYNNTLTITTDTALIEVEFYIRNYGSTFLHFQHSQVIDSAGQPIEHETMDGFVMIFIRNIMIKEIAIPTQETYVGRLIPVGVTVLNDGDITENFSVSLFYDAVLIETKNVVNLQPKENVTLIFNWDTAPVSPRLAPYIIRAEATILPYEVNVTDNTLIDGAIKLKIVGDVNGDGEVGINDLIAWDAAYETHAGDPNWNEQADINMDGVVDKTDANLILEHYKETV